MRSTPKFLTHWPRHWRSVLDISAKQALGVCAAQQYRYFSELFPDDVVFMQVRAFCEFYVARQTVAPDAGPALKAMRPTRRGVRMGFPLAQWRERLHSLLRQGHSVLLVAETGKNSQRLWECLPLARWVMNMRRSV